MELEESNFTDIMVVALFNLNYHVPTLQSHAVDHGSTCNYNLSF